MSLLLFLKSSYTPPLGGVILADTIRVRKRDASNFVAGAVIIGIGGDYYL